MLRVVAPDGWSLGVERRGEGGPRGVLLLLHAMMVDRRSMDRPAGAGLASHLAAAGWEVWLADLRGRGASGPPAAQAGWGYDALVERDLPALLRAARGAAGRRPVVVVGHSLGGHVALAAVAGGAPAPDALVLVAANAWLADDEPRGLARAAKALTLRAFAVASRPLGRFPARALRAGPVDEPAEYVQDFLRFWREARWGTADGRVDWRHCRVELPVLAVLGTGDALLARPDAAAAFVLAAAPRAEVWLVGEGRYGVAGRPGHMALVTSAACAPWWDRLVAWLEAAVARGDIPGA